MVVGERPPSHQRRDHRNLGQLGKTQELFGGAGLDYASADVEQWALRLGDVSSRLLDLPVIGFGDGLVSGQVDLRRWLVLEFRLENVLWDIY
jgi:hypothetical protein